MVSAKPSTFGGQPGSVLAIRGLEGDAAQGGRLCDASRSAGRGPLERSSIFIVKFFVLGLNKQTQSFRLPGSGFHTLMNEDGRGRYPFVPIMYLPMGTSQRYRYSENQQTCLSGKGPWTAKGNRVSGAGSYGSEALPGFWVYALPAYWH